MKTDAHLVQYSVFKPILDTLQHTGVNTETLLARSSPGRFDLSNDENYVPVNLMYGLLYERDHEAGTKLDRETLVSITSIEKNLGETASFTDDIVRQARRSLLLQQTGSTISTGSRDRECK